MNFIKVLDQEFGFSNIDTLHISQDILLMTFVLSNKKSYAPLPTFDITALDKFIAAQETDVSCIDWLISKTKQTMRCVLICFQRPKSLNPSTVLGVFNQKLKISNCDHVPQDQICRAVKDSLIGQDFQFNVVVQEEVISDREVFVHLNVCLEDCRESDSFIINGKKWVATLKKTINDLKLQPIHIEFVEIPISQVMLRSKKWHEFAIFLRLKRKHSSNIIHHAQPSECTIRPKKQVQNQETTLSDDVVRSGENQIEHVSESISKDTQLFTNKIEAHTTDFVKHNDSSATLQDSGHQPGEEPNHREEQQRHPKWKRLLHGVTLGLIFGTLPMWNLMSEF